jgi:hypothetical protein
MRFNPRFEPWIDQGFFFTCSTVLPLTCSIFSHSGEKIGATRFELATSRSRTVRSIQAELRPVNACSLDSNVLATSVNSINPYRDHQNGSAWRLDLRPQHAVPAVSARSS